MRVGQPQRFSYAIIAPTRPAGRLVRAMGEGAGPTRDISVPPRPGSAHIPSLLVELEPWGRTFLENLQDWIFRREPPPQIGRAHV